MLKKINLEEILNQHLKYKIVLELDDDDLMLIKTAMKDACNQVLELAAENAKANDFIEDSNIPALTPNIDIKVNKQSILNTINQIE